MKQLAWIGRQKSRAIASVVLVAILFPPLGDWLRPFVAEAVIGLLCIAFLRLDGVAFRSLLRRPMIVVAAVLWTSFALPAAIMGVSWLLNLDQTMPAVYLGLMMQALASPLMAAPAFALVMGLDATLVLLTLTLSTALVPITAPLFAAAAGLDFQLSPLWLGIKLLAILAGSAAVGLTLKHLLGPPALDRYREEIDGINILIMLVFASAVMGDIGVEFLARPLLLIGLTVLAFAVFALLFAVTSLVFAAAGGRRAMALGLTASLRNMGLLVAGTGGVLPELTWTYFAVSQFPIYLAPLLLEPITRLFGPKAGR